MNLGDLQTVQSKERSQDSLQHLSASFYEDVADYVANLKDERDRATERAASPFDDPEVARLTEEIQTAEAVVEAVYERRVGKLVKQASLAAVGMPVDTDGMTAEEQDLFDALVDRIEANKASALAAIGDHGGDADAGTGAAAEQDADVPDVSAADVMGGGPA